MIEKSQIEYLKDCVKRDRLPKFVDGLCDEITTLWAERDALKKQITDLQTRNTELVLNNRELENTQKK